MWTVLVFDPEGVSEGQNFDTETEARRYMKEELRWESTESCELYNAEMALVEHQPSSFTDGRKGKTMTITTDRLEREIDAISYVYQRLGTSRDRLRACNTLPLDSVTDATGSLLAAQRLLNCALVKLGQAHAQV